MSAYSQDDPAFPSGRSETIYGPGGSQLISQYPINSGISFKAYAAIHLKVPDSGISWLDDMIQKSLEQNQIMILKAENVE